MSTPDIPKEFIRNLDTESDTILHLAEVTRNWKDMTHYKIEAQIIKYNDVLETKSRFEVPPSSVTSSDFAVPSISRRTREAINFPSEKER